MVEGVKYFPPQSVSTEYLKKNDEKSSYPRKGTCEYYDVVIGTESIATPAWGNP